MLRCPKHISTKHKMFETVSGYTGLKTMENYDRSHRKYIVFLCQLTLRRIGSSPAGDEAPLTKACLHNLIKQDPFTTIRKLLTFRRMNKICLPHKKCNLRQDTKYSLPVSRLFNRFMWIFYRKHLSVFLMLSDVVVIISPQVFTKRDHLNYEIHFVCFLLWQFFQECTYGGNFIQNYTLGKATAILQKIFAN